MPVLAVLGITIIEVPDSFDKILLLEEIICCLLEGNWEETAEIGSAQYGDNRNKSVTKILNHILKFGFSSCFYLCFYNNFRAY